MSVYKDKNGSYYIKHDRTTKRGFKTKKEALLYEARMMTDKIDDSNCFSISMYELIDDFIIFNQKHLAFTSYDKLSRTLNKYIKPNVSNSKINKIKEVSCRRFYEYIDTLNFSSNHKNYIFNTYKRLFEHAIKFYGLKSNPAKLFSPFTCTREEKIKKKNKDFNVWSDDEFSLFIAKVDDLTYKALFFTLYYTGLRIGEALALKWTDFEGNYLDINKTIPKLKKDNSFIIKEPKNISSIRKISLTSSLISCLNYLKLSEKKKKNFKDDWFIFGGIVPLSRSTITRVKDKAIRDSGVKRITIHEFRHSHASNLIADGVNIVSVSRRLGHSSVEMTLDVYTHLMSKTDDDMIQKIEKSSQNVLTKF